MLKNYFKIAFRNFWSNRIFTSVNLIGLSVSLTIVLLISIYVRYELSFDRHFAGGDRIYRIHQDFRIDNSIKQDIYLPTGVAFTFKNEIPGIESAIELTGGKINLSNGKQVVELNEISSTEDFFSTFSFEFIYGTAESALKDPRTIVLSQKTAQILYGNEDPVGKLLKDERDSLYQVSGVIKNVPSNTHFKADVITRIPPAYANQPLNWQAFSSIIQYIKLKPNVTISQIQKNLAPLEKKYNFPANLTILFLPLRSIHLYSHNAMELETNSDIKYVIIFALSGLLILFIACFNYVNLTTARSLRRATEVGIRKVMGASRAQLIFQFLGESMLFFLVSVLCSVVLTYSVYPVFTALIGMERVPLNLLDVETLIILSGSSLVFGTLAGLYPSFYLSAQTPKKVIHGVSGSGKNNIHLRKTLVVFQFVISLFFILSTIVIYEQLSFIKNKNLGFDKEHLLVLPSSDYKESSNSFQTELLKDPSIRSLSLTNWNLGKYYGAGTRIDSSMTVSKKSVTVDFLDVDFNFFQTLGIRLNTGRFLSPEFAFDTLNTNMVYDKGWKREQIHRVLASKSIVVNESFIKELGIKDPVGKVINKSSLFGTIVGVVKDFNGMSLHEPVRPVIISASGQSRFGALFIRVAPGNLPKTIAYINSVWKKYYPEKNPDVGFVDETLQKLYTSEQRMAGIFTTFAGLGILISCLGLFGLIAYTAEQRTKEIGIRKVLGATVANIVALLSGEFLWLIGIAIIITVPLAWWTMNNWLNDFAYRIELRWWMFAGAGLIIACISLLIMGTEAIKAGTANPVKSLRSE